MLIWKALGWTKNMPKGGYLYKKNIYLYLSKCSIIWCVKYQYHPVGNRSAPIMHNEFAASYGGCLMYALQWVLCVCPTVGVLYKSYCGCLINALPWVPYIILVWVSYVCSKVGVLCKSYH